MRDAAPVRAGLPAVVVIGGGFSAATLAVELARRGRLGGLALTVVDPTPKVGRGVAYQAHPAHRLNVPVERMGIADDPTGTFQAWVLANGHPANTGDFVPRNLFGEYVAERWHAECDATVTHARARAIDVARTGSGWRVGLEHGGALLADVVVLAQGHAAPRTPAALPLTVRAGPRYVARPWTEDAVQGVGRQEPVLVLGAGLTAVDVVVALRSAGHRARITLLSRRGLLPRPHASGPAAGPLPPLSLDGDLFDVIREVRTAVAAAEARGEPWQSVIDAVRHRVPALWRRLGDADRGHFLRHFRPWWDVYRHRIPTDIHRELERLQDAGVIDLVAGRLVDATPLPDGVGVTFRRRGRAATESLDVGHVVNATGADLDLAASGDALVRRLLAAGLLTRDAHAIGLVTDDDGTAVDASGARAEGLFVLGGARRPAEWECTAVPELRAQASSLAERLASRLLV